MEIGQLPPSVRKQSDPELLQVLGGISLSQGAGRSQCVMQWPNEVGIDTQGKHEGGQRVLARLARVEQ